MVHDAITLNIQCKQQHCSFLPICLTLIAFLFAIADPPEFLNSPLTQYDIIEGHSKSINLTALGNPSTITYKWKREDDSEIGSSGSRVTADGPVLNITKAQRADTGIYKLYATNELGTSETSIRVTVQCMIDLYIFSPNSNSLLFFRPGIDQEDQ